MATCRGKKKDGTPCRCSVILVNGYCRVHQGQSGERRLCLTEFVEENHKLLTVLGVFTALTVYASNLPYSWPGSGLAFVFMAFSIIILLQLFANLMSVVPTGLLAYCTTLMLAAVWFTLVYWLLAFRGFWREYLTRVLIVLLAGIGVSLFQKAVAHYGLLDRLFHPTPEKRQRYWLNLSLASYTLIGVLVVVPSFYLARGVNYVCDELYREMTAPTPTPTTTPTLALSSTPTATLTPVPSPTPTGTASATPTPAAITPTPMVAPTATPMAAQSPIVASGAPSRTGSPSSSGTPGQ